MSSASPSGDAGSSPNGTPRISARSSPVVEALRDIVAGTIGGIAGRVVEFPFDTIKTKLQAASLGA